MGDKYLQRAFQVLVDTPDKFHQLGNFEVIETHFLTVMSFDHIPSAILDLLNMMQYVPQFIVVHVGAVDLSKYNNLQQHQNIKTMMSKVIKLVKAVDTHHLEVFKGVFYSLMISIPGILAGSSKKPLGEPGPG